MSGDKYTEEHKVVYYETNVTGRLNIGNLVDLCMLTSTDQCAYLGISEERLDEMGYGWIISQNIIDVHRLPVEHEKVSISTQALSYNRYFCYRDFIMKDSDGVEIVKMHTVFCLMDKKKRKIVRIQDEIVAPFKAEYTTKVERLPVPPVISSKEVEFSQKYRVRFMDIDNNQHVNNVHYFDWMIDTLPEDFLRTHEVKQFNIVYKNEVRYGDTVDSLSQVDLDNCESIHEIKIGDKVSCTAKVQWQKLK